MLLKQRRGLYRPPLEKLIETIIFLEKSDRIQTNSTFKVFEDLIEQCSIEECEKAFEFFEHRVEDRSLERCEGAIFF